MTESDPGEDKIKTSGGAGDSATKSELTLAGDADARAEASGIELPPLAEDVLRRWQQQPVDNPVGDDARWERMAQEIQNRIDGSEADEDEAEGWLMQAPLAMQNGEPRRFSASDAPASDVAGRTSDHRSLREIAAATVAASKRRVERPLGVTQPKPAPPPPPSLTQARPVAGAKSLATDRANTTATKSQGAGSDAAKRPRPALKSVPDLPAEPVQPASEAAAARTSTSGKRTTSSWWWLGGMLAAAAAAVLVVTQPPSVEPSAAVPASETELAAAPAAQPPAHPAETEVEGRQESPEARQDSPTEVVQTEDLMPESPSSAVEEQTADPPQPVAAESVAQLAPRKAKASAPRAKPQPEAVEAEAIVLEEEPSEPETVAGSAEAMEPEMVPAAQPTGSRSVRPSMGAAWGAIGATLGQARLCVAGATVPSKATVVFGSTGQVQRVTVSGPAKGTPAETCIKSALGAARVQPFTDPEFAVPTTIRP